MCSTAFETLGRAQSKGLAHPDLPIAFVPHPFATINREGIRELAVKCAADIAWLTSPAAAPAAANAVPNRRAGMLSLSDDIEAVNRHFRVQRWTDGFPIIPPTAERVQRMLAATSRKVDEVIALVAPGYGEATVERIAINAVMAGCDPEYLPVLIAAVAAIASPQFNLQGIQATTNPVAAWLIVNGPVAGWGVTAVDRGGVLALRIGTGVAMISQLRLGRCAAREPRARFVAEQLIMWLMSA